jgi:hypothetical protein
MTKSYEIHDNGGRPFRVEIQGKEVILFKNMDTYKLVDGKFTTISNPEKQIKQFTADTIFVGKKSPQGGYDGLKPKEAEGNSLLLEVGSKYVYIGSEIYEWTPVKGDVVEAYYSNIGNSDVPYPYAIGRTHIYIMLDKVAVEKSFFNMKGDIYQQYYAGTTYLPMCLKGYQDTSICKDKEAAKARIKELKEKTVKLKKKVLQKRSL